MERCISLCKKMSIYALEPKENGLNITTELDADHTHDLEMRR